MNRLKLTTIIFLTVAAMCASCKKDDSVSVALNDDELLFSYPGQTLTTSFSGKNIHSLSASNTPNGWSCRISTSERTVTVTAPESFDDEEIETAGYFTLTARDKKGDNTAGVTLYVQYSDVVTDLSPQRSNSYIITQAGRRYTIDAIHKGESAETIETAAVDILWQTERSMVRYASFDKQSGKAEFYVGYALDDKDRRTDATPEGNALLAAYDNSGKIVWSWHLWITAADPAADAATYSNGTTFMNRNLGAACNSGGSPDEAKILASYGLYYQWGRKDPFAAPYYFDCASSRDERLYYGSANSYTYITYKRADSSIATREYAQANPMTYICGTEETGFDWLAAHDDKAWNDTAKSLHDPCPKGWRVPAGDAFAVLDIAREEDYAELESLKGIYGWNLTDSGDNAKHFYLGGGRRSYVTGQITNMNDDDFRPLPWTGYYWTSASAANSRATAMSFDLNTAVRAEINGFDARSAEYRAEGMQVRCVKEQ